MIKSVSGSSRYTVPKDYTAQFHRAYLTFLFQVVYDPDSKKLAYLSEPQADDSYGKLLLEMEDKTFLGDLNRTDDSQLLSEDTFEYILSQKNTVEPLAQEINHQNCSAENDENSGDSSCKDLSSSESKSAIKKKPVSCQKKLMFVAKKGVSVRIPSPFKNKILNDVKKTTSFTRF